MRSGSATTVSIAPWSSQPHWPKGSPPRPSGVVFRSAICWSNTQMMGYDEETPGLIIERGFFEDSWTTLRDR
jgi:hypothetical protein